MTTSDPVSWLGHHSLISLSFHQSQNAPDHEIRELQHVSVNVPHSGECFLAKLPNGNSGSEGSDCESQDGNIDTYLLAMNSMDAFAICTKILTPAFAFKLEIESNGINVAAPNPDFGPQNYFVTCGEEQGGKLWIEGVAHQKEPRLVRQFVALTQGTGHSHPALRDITEQAPSIMIKMFIGLRVKAGKPKSKGRRHIFARPHHEPEIFRHPVLELSHNCEDRPVKLKVPVAQQSLVNTDDTSRDLEVGPGGMIRQVFTEDKGEYEWQEVPMEHVAIRIVDPDTYLGLTGLEHIPPNPPFRAIDMGLKQMIRVNNARDMNSVQSIAEHQHEAPSEVPFRDIDRKLAAAFEPGGQGRVLDPKPRRGLRVPGFHGVARIWGNLAGAKRKDG